jgi:YbbR domain-containing protein
MKKMLFENLGLKVSAVLIAVLLWLFVTWRGQSEVSFDVPIEFKDVPIGLGIVSVSAKSANVTVKGQDRIMKSLRPSDIRVLVDMDKARKGEGSFHINKDDVKLPYAMSVRSIEPSTIRVRLDETVTKSVPVRASITGTPGSGFYIKSVDVEPKSIVIQGLKTEVRKIDEIGTDQMDISGTNSTQTQELNIDAAGANIKPEKEKVRVTVVIAGGKK